MATRLKKIKVNEVSLVSRPAIAKEFMLFKSEDGAQEEPVVVEEVAKNEQPVVEAPVVEAAPEVVKEPEPVPEPAIDTMKEAEPEVEKAKMESCKGCKKLFKPEELEGGECKECGKPVKKEAVETVSKELELAKQLESERIQKEALMKELDELKKAAEVQKEAEITKEFIEKAAVDMKHVPTVSAAVFGPVLRQAAKKLEKSEFDAIYNALKASNEFIAKNNQLSKELGVGGEDLSADPASQLDSIAKSIVQKDSSLTFAKAYQLACERNPQIYAEHVRQARNR